MTEPAIDRWLRRVVLAVALPQSRLFRRRVRGGAGDRLGFAVRRQHRFPRRYLGQPADFRRAGWRRCSGRASAWRSARSCWCRPGDAMDGLGKFLRPGAAVAVPPVAGRARRACRQSQLRLAARTLPAPRGSLTRAAFLSARNDALANVAIIAAGPLTAFMPPRPGRTCSSASASPP